MFKKKNRVNYFLTAWAFLLLATANTWANASEQKPFLWEVRTSQQSAPAYLFGTIHSGNPKVNQFPPAVQQAFDQADHFYAELELDQDTMQRLQHSMLSNDPQRLMQQLGAERQQRINQLLRQLSPNLQLQSFSNFRLWAFAASFSMLEDQLRFPNAPAMDLRLYRLARAQGKTLGGLETIDEQVAIFKDLTDKQLLMLLDADLSAMEKAHAQHHSVMDEIYQAYLSGDSERFATLMKDEEAALPPDLATLFANKLLDNRNQRMAQRIAEKLRQHPQQHYFFAVGAAHFANHGGIQQLLRQQGFQVRRVTP